MEFVKLGNTGMDVSRFCLGCMSFGDTEKWIHKWVLDEENSRLIIKKALELGINNLIYREEEREMMPLCREEKIGVTPYSPMASGRLIRDWSETTKRLETDQIARSKYDTTANSDKLVVDRVAEIAEKRGVLRIHIALAWLLHKAPVTAPIIGATKISHLEDAMGAISVKLTTEEVAYLEEPYVPHGIVGHN